MLIRREGYRTEYGEKDKEVKTSLKSDKKKFIEDKAEEAEQAAQKQDSRTLFQIVKSLAKNSFGAGGDQVKDRDGSLLTTTEDQLKRWAQHFQEVLNRPDPSNPPQFDEEQHDLGICVEDFSRREVADALRSLKNNKAAGADGIVALVLKVDIDSTAVALTMLFNKIWTEEKVPEDWLKGLIVKLPKKGDLTNCNNWRGITLLAVVSKVFSRCLLNHFQEKVDKILRREQAGFRPGCSCSDQIFVIRTILEESIEYNSPLFINFIDFEKAFDSIHRESLWKILRIYGLPEKLIKMIRILYDGFKCCVMHNGEESPWFDVLTHSFLDCDRLDFKENNREETRYRMAG